MPYFELNSLSGLKYSSRGLDNKFGLIILFNPYDCSQCLNEASYWEKIFETFSSDDLVVLGISNIRRKYELKAFIRRKRIKFPVLLDENANINKLLKINRTPIKLLISPEKDIIYAQYANNIKSENIELIDMIGYFINDRKNSTLR